MDFTNRVQEMARLNRLISSKEAGVAVLWGRRRIGKSRLLVEWVQKTKGIYYVADESAASIQRKYFSACFESVLPGFSEVEYTDWTSLFTRLARDCKNAKWRGPIVIDELPYLIGASPELPSVLQKFLDHEAKLAKLIIVLCGSSQKMMQGAILEPSAPLYGRSDEIIKLNPISITYIGEALNLKTPRSIVESYAIWGGIPRYWELVAKNNNSFLKNIDQIVLDPMSPLHEEPGTLLLEEAAMHLRPILDAIGMGYHRLSDVAARIGQPATSMMRSIQRLIELDLIQREWPFGSNENNSKRTLYKIKDPFLRFWFEVLAPRRSFFSRSTSPSRLQVLKNALPKLFSLFWEELCRFAVPFLSEKWGKERYQEALRFWQGQDSEWDVVAKSEDGKSMLLGEAKWSAKPASRAFIETTLSELKYKGIPPVTRPTNGKILYVIFVPEKPPKLSFPPDVKIVDAKEILKALEN